MLAVIAGALALAPYVAVYAITVTLFDGAADSTRVWTIAAAVGAALVGRSVLSAASSHLAHVTAYRVLADLRLELVARLRRMPLDAVRRRPVGELKKTLGDDVEQLEEALAHGIPDLAAAIAVPITTTALLFFVDWRLALVALAALVIVVVVSGYGMSRAQKSNVEFLGIIARMNNSVMGFLQGIKVIRGYLRPDAGYHQAKRDIVDSFDAQQRLARGPLVWVVSAMSALAGLAVALLIPVAGSRFVSGGIDLGVLALFLVLGLAYLSPLMGLVGVLATIITRLQFAGAAVGELLVQPDLAEPTSPRRPDSSGPVEIRFERVRFAYGDEVVFDDLDLVVRAGSTVAVVGATGVGKSTMGRLLARFADPDAGRITIGGVDVRSLTTEDLVTLVAFVQQDEYLFAASLMDNIRIARPDATDEEVLAVADAAELTDLATTLPDGWRTVLSSGDGGLSGGQRQRVSIARALLKDAEVIVLDEATAALDARTEAATLKAIRELTAGRTTIAIAHRLATIRDADEIVLIADGGVAARGAHHELLADDRYRDLWRDYENAAGWQLDAATDATAADAPEPPPRRDDAALDEWDRAALSMVRPRIGGMGFLRQWQVLLGRGRADLLRRGLPRLLLEGLVRGVPILAVYLLLDNAIDAASGGDPVTIGQVWATCGLVVFGILARLLAAHWANRTVFTIAARGKADLQLSLIERLRRVPLGYFDRAEPSRTASVITSDTTMIDFQNVPQMLTSAVLQPVYLGAALMVIDWRLALCALAGLPIFLVATAVSDGVYHRAFADVHQARSAAGAALLEQARGAAVIRSAPESELTTRYRAAVESLRSASVSMSVRALPSTAIGSVAVELGLVLTIVVGAALYTGGGVSASVLLIFLMLSLVMYQPIQQLNELAGYRRNQQEIAAKIGEIWDEPILPEPLEPRSVQTIPPTVQFDAVDFAYRNVPDSIRPHDHLVLHDVSFTAPAGTITALVGSSGAGKTTVANLVGRLWDVTDGAVRIDGVDVRELGTESVMRLVTTVYQDSYLFGDTVAFNMRIGQPDATDAEIWRALEAAACADVVAALPDGLDTVLADGGTDLSGGQRQRLCIARALLKDSPVVVLDEAVASVDPTTESRIQQALASLMSGRTVIVIAHRLDTLHRVDQVVVLDGGRVTGVGPPTTMLDVPSDRTTSEPAGADV
ncbi:putative ABC transporter permease/ATP-binding protein [Gordonia soli NBRC 108243]|uniref:Putative ABC transporter permease/ATP-binding protein n=1 Tax=Gordonia soli NBRC 108243 TaxID=1223545 RepID=M0QPX5_9ACTN|nr:putative ABC transporter permease/ATP-binding protein [Gordonia soli NBRC 108243]